MSEPSNPDNASAPSPSDIPETRLTSEKAFAPDFPAGSTPDPNATTDDITGRSPVLDYTCALALPMQLGRYLLVEEIAHGGMGAVLRAQDKDFHRELAVKVLLPHGLNSEQLRMRFLEEAQIMGQLQHPGIPPVHELGELPDGRPFFAMKLIQGQTLSQLLRSPDERISADTRFLNVFLQICQTMAYAHSQNVIHRDLKPGNIMVGAFGEVQVMDWGLAKLLSRGTTEVTTDPKTPPPLSTTRSESSLDLTIPGNVMGTPAYLAPEQAHGDIATVDQRSDVFGLGAILCEMLTGKPPYQANSTQQLYQMAGTASLSEAWARLDACDADPELIALTKRCLSSDPDQRPANGDELAAVLKAHQSRLQERLRQSEIEQARAIEQRKRRRTRQTFALSMMVLLLGMTGAGLWYHDRNVRIEEKITGVNDQVEKQFADLHADLNDPKQFSALMSDLKLWQTKLKQIDILLQQAEGLSRGDPLLLADAIQNKTQSLRQRLKQGRSELAFVRELDQARIRTSFVYHRRYDPEAVLPEYVRLFQKRLGVNLKKDAVDKIVSVLRKPPLRFVLLATLDHAASILETEEDKPLRMRLLQIAHKVDERNGWRDRFRKACLSQDPEKQKQELIDLRAVVSTSEQYPQMLTAFLRETKRHGVYPEVLIRQISLLYPHDFWLQFELGAISRKLLDRIGCYRTALTLRPDDPVVLNNLGGVIGMSGAWAAAEVHLRHGVEVAPEMAILHGNLGQVLRLDNRPGEAEPFLRRAIQLDPKLAEAWVDLGVVLFRLKKLDEALVALNQAKELMPRSPRVYFQLAMHAQAKADTKLAEQHYHKVLEYDLNHAEALVNLANLLSRTGRREQGIPYLKRAIKATPEFVPAHFNLAYSYLRLGKFDRAIQSYEKVVDLNPRHIEAVYQLGTLWAFRKQHVRAIEYYRRALAIDKKHVQAHIEMTISLMKIGQLEEALHQAGLAHDLSLNQSNGPSRRTAHLLARCRRMAELDKRLPAILQKTDKPKTSQELMEFATLCYRHKALFLASAEMFHSAFLQTPQLKTQAPEYLSIAARAALQVDAGNGPETIRVPLQQRTFWRGQALLWLTEELNFWKKHVRIAEGKKLATMQSHLKLWNVHKEFLRAQSPEGTASWSQKERDEWAKLWQDHKAVLQQLEAKQQ